MSKETRDINIYKKYVLSRIPVYKLAGEYGLKPSTITKIINKYENKFQNILCILDDMYNYIVENYSMGIATRIYNSLIRYITSFAITDIDSLITDIKTNKYIRGIGEKFISIILEYCTKKGYYHE